MSEPPSKRVKLAVAAEEAENVDSEDLKDDPEVTPELQDIQDVQAKLDKLHDEGSDAVLRVEQEYNLKKRPFYEERAKAILKVPQFWKQAIERVPGLCEYLAKADRELLTYLEDLRVEQQDDIKSGFKVTLLFNDNPFFDNKELVRNLKYKDDGSLTIVATQPRWKAAYSHESTRTDLVFFRQFTYDADLPAGNRDEISDIIKEELWPNPTPFYFSEPVDEDGEGEFDDDDLDDYEDGEGEEDEPGEGEEGDVDEGEEGVVVEGEEGDFADDDLVNGDGVAEEEDPAEE